MSTSLVRAGGPLSAVDDTVTLQLGGMGACVFQLSGTFVATLLFEVSLTEDPADWKPLTVTPPNSTTTATGATAAGLWSGSVAGMAAARVRCTAFTSGQAFATLQAVAAGGSGGSGGGSGGGAVTIADGADVTQGATADAKATDSTSSWSVVALLKGLYALLVAGITPVPDTTNGWLVAQMTSADGSTALTATAQAIKASAGKLGGWYIYNPNSAATYVPIYNVAAGSVTVGTTNPQLTLCIPPTAAANVEFAMGIPFTNTGWSVAATTTGGGNGAPSIALEANFFYK